MPVKATKSQEAAIKYFAGYPLTPGVKMPEQTLKACRERGWIEKTDDFPFHRTTDLGRSDFGLPPAD